MGTFLAWLPAAVACLGLVLAGGGDRYMVAWWMQGRPAPLAAGQTALRVGVDASYPPFAAVDEQGRLWGLEVDVADALAARLGLPVQVANTDAGSGLDALRARAYDAILAQLMADPALAKTARFSRPYFDAGPALLVRPDTPWDLQGLRVQVEVGSPWTAERVALQRAGALVETVWDIQEAAQHVAAGASDALLVDRPTALEAVRDDPSAGLSVRLLGDRAAYGHRVALGRANRALALSVDWALGELRRDGTLARIEQRWFGASSEARRGG